MWNVRGEIKSSIKRSLKRKIVTFLSLSMIASSMTPPSVIMADELDEDASFIEETQEAEEINDSGYEEPVLGTEDLPDDSTSCDQGGDHEWEYVANNHNYCETPRINTYRCKKCGKTQHCGEYAKIVLVLLCVFVHIIPLYSNHRNKKRIL